MKSGSEDIAGFLFERSKEHRARCCMMESRPLFPLGGGGDRGNERKKRKKKKKKRRHHHHHHPDHDDDDIEALQVDGREEKRVTGRTDIFHEPSATSSLPSLKSFLLESWGDEGNVAFEKPDSKSVPVYHQCGRSLRLKGQGTGARESTWKRYFEVDRVKGKRARPLRRLGNTENAKGKQDEMTPEIILFAEFQGEEEEDNSARPTSDKEDYLVSTSRRLNRQVQVKPHVPKAWLELVEFQEEAMELRGGGVSARSASLLQSSLSEKRISILESALRHCPESEEIALRLMEEMTKILPDEELNEKLEGIVKRFVSCEQITFRYIGVRSSQFSTFDADSMRVIYSELVQHVVHAREAAIGGGDSETKAKLEKLVVDLIFSCCRMHLSTGNQHIAIAIIQSLLEYNLFCPESVRRLSRSSRTRAFESYWKSNCSDLIGEEGAQGWSSSYSEHHHQHGAVGIFHDSSAFEPRYEVPSKKQKQPGQEEDDSEGSSCEDGLEEEVDEKIDEQYRSLLDTKSKHSDVFSMWLSLEKEREAKNWKHSKSSELGKEGSTEMQFEDIEDFIVELDLQTSDHHLIYLLSLLGLFETQAPYNRLSYMSLRDDLEYLDSTCFPFLDIAKECNFSSKAHWLEGLPKLGRWSDLHCSRTKFLCNTIKALGNSHSSSLPLWEQLFELVFDLEISKGVDAKLAKAAVEKCAKEYIAGMKGNVSIWGAYAQFQMKQGSFNTACKIYLNVLSSLKESQFHSENVPSMFLDFANVLHSQKKLAEKFNIIPESVLGALGCQVPLAEFANQSADLTRFARQGFQKIIQDSVSKGSLETEAEVALILAAAKFEQLHENCSGAYTTCRQIVELLASNGASPNRHCFQFCQRSVNLVQSLRTAERKGFHDYLQLCLKMFPSDPFLLCAYMKEEYRCGAFFRCQRTLTILLEKSKSVPNLLALLIHQTEKKNYVMDYSFEKYLASGFGQSSCMVWRSYLRYILGSGKVEEAKRNYFRAIQSCPWSKEMFLDGIVLLNKHLNGKEKLDILSLMEEKSIALHTDLYEVLLEEIEFV